MLGSVREANALTQAEWETVADYINAYVSGSQYGPADDGELGFMHTAAQYKVQIDSNGDGILCGVDDDMANRPVLVDNLMSNTTLIPGTSIRNQWNSASTTVGGMSSAVLTALKAKVDAHREAGFSPDISVY
jgi:hypothetical protein